MNRVMLFVALILVISAGCRKSYDRPEPAAGNQAAGGGFGAEQAVRGAVNRVVTAAELHDLHLFMSNAKLSMGRVPTYQETWSALNQPGGNAKLVQLIKDGILVMVQAPQDEGLWAYGKEVPTQGGWILTHSGAERVTAQDFANRFGRN
jgi:hypothetical protein